MAAKPIPDGYHTVTPYLYLRNATGALDYYKRAFGAVETFRMQGRTHGRRNKGGGTAKRWRKRTREEGLEIFPTGFGNGSVTVVHRADTCHGQALRRRSRWRGFPRGTVPLENRILVGARSRPRAEFLARSDS